MTQQIIENGSLGLFARTAINENFTELYSHIIVGVDGGGSYGSRSDACRITAGTKLYDVGLRIVTKDNTDTEDPNYPYGTYSALDIELSSPEFSGGKALRVFTHQDGGRSLAAYINEAGAFLTRTGLICSGTFSNHTVNEGDDTIIQEPLASDGIQGAMICAWADVDGCFLARAANITGLAWLWEGLNRDGSLTSKIWEDGTVKIAGSFGANNKTPSTPALTSSTTLVQLMQALENIGLITLD